MSAKCINVNVNADRLHEWKLFQIGDVVFGFPTRSIAQHKINILNAE